MSNLILASLFFLISHIGLALVPVREAVIGKIGEMGFRAGYSIISLIGIVWMIRAYGNAPFEPIWEPGPGLAHLSMLFMPIAVFLLVCALTGPNPTAVGQNPDADEGEPAKGMIRITRHPMMWGIALWGISHILANGDQAALVLFGTFTVLALGGAHALDAKRSARPVPGWGVFVQSTSFWPFGAIIQGRNRFVWHEIGIKPVLIAAVVFIAFFAIHPWLFGVSPLPL